jgi:hypothetical protein
MRISGCSDLDSLEEQYPNSCRISKNFIGPLWGSRKIIIYKSNLRLSTGQHKIWGDVGPDIYASYGNSSGSFKALSVEIRELMITSFGYLLEIDNKLFEWDFKRAVQHQLDSR